MKTTVIINEQHSLLPDQEWMLKEFDEEYNLLKVPASGWTYEEVQSIADVMIDSAEINITPEHPVGLTVIFVSPVPALLMLLSKYEGMAWENGFASLEVRLLHNDRREKKELPDGRIIQAVAKEGWKLV